VLLSDSQGADGGTPNPLDTITTSAGGKTTVGDAVPEEKVGE